MSLFKRLRNLIGGPAPAPAAERSILTVGPGDVCEVSLITYQVTGSIRNHQRNTAMLTLQDGTDFRYLLIEERELTVFALYAPIDGRLDSIEEVPMTLELDDRVFHMEEHYAGFVVPAGKTPFMRGGDQAVWNYQTDDKRLLRVEWMDGRFVLYEGETVLPADVRIIRGS
ncbi:MAG TPA: DUF4178 domain-containing protein [Paenibacillus sp.]|uniref:DUF4178 domain-containing protein n=1 Tax=Paenibacillus sp. TaxID=58172 RepID=UPI002CE504B0|nr:DUF4178 domain-containing protein [Paenibacillus sp.]HUC92189.1 DUF4178 domain-containing protein [Paenibacillus sp.]